MNRRRFALLLALATVWCIAAPADAAPNLGAVSIDLQLVVTLDEPMAMATRAGDNALYFAEKRGVVRKRAAGVTSTLLNISREVSTGGEQGLLGLVISPAGDRLFINYTDVNGDTIIESFPFNGGRIVRSSGVRIIKIDQPFDNHNGGNLVFGPDGFLYVAMGDGGGQNDPGNRSQNLGSLLGKMLRIRPRSAGGYSSPAGNPYVGVPGRNEIWARGFRNPWRYSFDAALGDLWVGDVGGGRREEVDRQLVSSRGGENYGWQRMEGTVHVNGGIPPNHKPPVHEYSHDDGRCAVVGGFVYRGSAIPALRGAYLYSDLCDGVVRAMTINGRTHRNLGESRQGTVSFGQDNARELYLLTLSGSVWRIVPSS